MRKTIDFESYDDLLVLVYRPQDGTEWLREKLEKEDHTIQNTFTVKKKDIYKPEKNNENDVLDNIDEEYEIRFKLAELEQNIWKFSKRIMGIEYDLRIDTSVQLDARCFTAVRNRSIFRSINSITNAKSISIGGAEYDDDCISEEDFKSLIAQFPNTYELDKYVRARIAAVLKDRFSFLDDYERSYHDYLNKKISKSNESSLFGEINEYEIKKYTNLHSRLLEMLNDENSYSERNWQNEIVKFILLLFPKYIYAFTEAPVLDKQQDKVRALDFLLVDSTGNIDIIEIKKPFDKSLVTHSGYRDNYIPLRELSGTVMQIEKYIFHLMKSGRKGEKKFNKKYKQYLHNGFEIRISNPKGMIISGRTHNLSFEQLRDLEIIKRKYHNIVDIISYDDLLMRLEHAIKKIQTEI